MDQNNPFGEYLKGALAGKNIESPARVGECPDSFDEFPEGAFFQLVVPPAVVAGSSHEISVRVRNCLPGGARGNVTLQGEEIDRGTSYDFQAPFAIEPAQQGTCLVFVWAVPRLPTKVKWSATVSITGQTGVDSPVRSAMTIVTRPTH